MQLIWNIVEFEVSKLETGQAFLRVLQFYPTNNFPPMFHTH